MARRGKVKQVETRDVIDRPARSRKYRYLMLIVCEDENTERVYFEQFHKLFNDLLPSETVYIRAVGTGRNSLGVVNQAIIERNLLATEAGKKVDEVWAVFDKDDLDKVEKTRENFEQAFVKAAEENIRIAYSNECFELWLLLHFCSVSEKEPIPRAELYARLVAAINKHHKDFVYDHGDASVLTEIQKYGNEVKAIERAVTLDEYHQKENHPPIEANPRTLVYKLVTQLRQWFAFYSYK